MLWKNKKDAKIVSNDFHHEHTSHFNNTRLDFSFDFKYFMDENLRAVD